MATADQSDFSLDFLSGDIFKAAEAESQSYLTGPYAVLRVDGKGFSSLTKSAGYAVPYDLGFMASMDEAAKALLKLVDGSIFAYAQSDEISVAFKCSGPPVDRNWWFGGKVQKIASLTAARASLSFLRAELTRLGEFSLDPLFDSRVISLESEEAVEQYLRWRRFDAQKNSISMAASSLFSHRELDSVSSKDRAAMLQGTELERLPDGFFNGRLHYRASTMLKAWEPIRGSEVDVQRTVHRSEPADRATVERVLPELLRSKIYGKDTSALSISEAFDRGYRLDLDSVE